MSEENMNLITNLSSDGDFYYGIETDSKYIEGGKRRCKVKIPIKKKASFIEILKGVKNYREEEIIIEPNCRFVFPKGELDRDYTIIYYVSPDFKKGVDILKRNIKGFALIEKFQSEALQYKKYFEESLKTIKAVETILRPIEQTNAKISNQVFELFETLKNMIPREQEKK